MDTTSHSVASSHRESTDWKDLASRESGGLEISLLWCAPTGQTKVTVNDRRSGEEFELPVKGGDALAAFYHPFAFMARPSVPAVEQQRDSHDLQLQR
jgi:hypothetical protein